MILFLIGIFLIMFSMIGMRMMQIEREKEKRRLAAGGMFLIKNRIEKDEGR
jgi:hypothetical protein